MFLLFMAEVSSNGFFSFSFFFVLQYLTIVFLLIILFDLEI